LEEDIKTGKIFLAEKEGKPYIVKVRKDRILNKLFIDLEPLTLKLKSYNELLENSLKNIKEFLKRNYGELREDALEKLKTLYPNVFAETVKEIEAEKIKRKIERIKQKIEDEKANAFLFDLKEAFKEGGDLEYIKDKFNVDKLNENLLLYLEESEDWTKKIREVIDENMFSREERERLIKISKEKLKRKIINEGVFGSLGLYLTIKSILPLSVKQFEKLREQKEEERKITILKEIYKDLEPEFVRKYATIDNKGEIYIDLELKFFKGKPYYSKLKEGNFVYKNSIWNVEEGEPIPLEWRAKIPLKEDLIKDINPEVYKAIQFLKKQKELENIKNKLLKEKEKILEVLKKAVVNKDNLVRGYETKKLEDIVDLEKAEFLIKKNLGYGLEEYLFVYGNKIYSYEYDTEYAQYFNIQNGFLWEKTIDKNIEKELQRLKEINKIIKEINEALIRKDISIDKAWESRIWERIEKDLIEDRGGTYIPPNYDKDEDEKIPLDLSDEILIKLQRIDPKLEKTLGKLNTNSKNIVELANNYLKEKIKEELKAFKENKGEVKILKDYYDLEELKQMLNKNPIEKVYEKIKNEVEFVYPEEAFKFLLEREDGERRFYKALKKEGIDKETFIKMVEDIIFEFAEKESEEILEELNKQNEKSNKVSEIKAPNVGQIKNRKPKRN
jgi:hypothetical protein